MKLVIKKRAQGFIVNVVFAIMLILAVLLEIIGALFILENFHEGYTMVIAGIILFLTALCIKVYFNKQKRKLNHIPQNELDDFLITSPPAQGLEDSRKNE